MTKSKSDTNVVSIASRDPVGFLEARLRAEIRAEERPGEDIHARLERMHSESVPPDYAPPTHLSGEGLATLLAMFVVLGGRKMPSQADLLAHFESGDEKWWWLFLEKVVDLRREKAADPAI